MVVGRLDDLEQALGDPVHRLRDERGVGYAERHGQRIEPFEVTSPWCGVALGADRRSRRGLFLGQAIDLVVVQEHGQVHVVADRMNPVSRSDTAAVAVAGVDENGEVRASQADAFGDGQRAAVDAVEAVGLHVVREAAGAADARNEHGLFRTQPFVAAQALDGGEDGVVAATGAPAGYAALVVLEFKLLFVEIEQTFSR